MAKQLELDHAQVGGGRRRSSSKGRRLPAEVLTRDEVQALRRACRVYETNGRKRMRESIAGERDAALLALLYRSGLRVSEALNLRPADYCRVEGTIRVRCGKGGKSRTVPIDDDCAAVLDDWLRRRAELDVGSRSPIFCTTRAGKSNPVGSRVDASYLRHLLPELAAEAGITRRVHAHAFRHTYAAELLTDGRSVVDIRDLLGHKSLATTSVYLASIGVTPRLVEAIRSRPAWDR